MSSRPSLAPFLAVLGAAALFGTSGTARELGPDSARPVAVACWRIAIGSVVLVALVGPRRVATVERALWPLVLLAGAAVAIYQTMFFVGVSRIGVATGTVIAIATGPVVVGAVESVVERRRPATGWLVATGVALGGGWLLAGRGGDDSSSDVAGIAAAVVSGTGYAIYSLLAKQLVRRGLAGPVAMASMFTAGAVLLLPVLVLTSGGWLASWSGTAMVVYLGVFSIGIAYQLFGVGIEHLTTSTVVTLVLAEPLTATLLGTVVLDEPLGVRGAIGCALVMLSVVIVQVTTAAGTPTRTGRGEAYPT